MGPRSSDRGNGVALLHDRPPEQLQWGRDRLIAEMRRFPDVAADVEDASMGPRSSDRGNAVALEEAAPDFRASMGPRSSDRGNTRSLSSRLSSILLQWGRDRLIAEIGK